MDEKQQIKRMLYRINKEITKLKYEGELFTNHELMQMIETLQHHIFLVHTFFDKPEFNTSSVKQKLLEKLEQLN